MVNKIIIGLTGKYCAGKNHIALLLEKRGLPVLDVDKLGHRVIEMEKNRLTARFGSDILGSDGCVDRKLLGSKVFGRSGELAALEEIIHPVVNRETLAWIRERKEKACVINAALLHRSSAFDELTAIIIVEAPLIARMLRARKRDHLSWAAISKRFRSQRSFDTQYLKGKADIYKVSNPSFCRAAGFSGFGGQKQRDRPEKRIDEILSLLGVI